MRIRDCYTMQLSESQFFENDKGILLAEASELGLRPGEWPDSIDLRRSDGRMIHYRIGKVEGDQQELEGVWYEPDAGGESRVLIVND